MYNFSNEYPEYDVSTDGVVYKNGSEIKPFKSNGYLQVLLFDKEHNKKICGVHTVVAMKYLDYYDDCIVHHKDENKQNNNVENLEILTREQHSFMHNIENTLLADYVRKNGPHNKGKKMSEEFRKHCSESAKKRGFNGNQFVDKNKDPRK